MLRKLPIFSLIVATCISFAEDRVTLTGRVTDNLGKALEDTTVMVYRAGVKKGYSTYCPTCYADCGKRTVTDRTGSFTIKSLESELWFDLLLIRDGYSPVFVKKVDPAHGPVDTTALGLRKAVNDPQRIVRGRVVDVHGLPLRAAVVEPLGVETILEGSGPASMYGTIEGLEPVAVSNPNGEFELAHSQSATGMLLRVEARGMATKLIAVPTGATRTTITVTDGAVIRGRLMNQGKPVASAELGLVARERGGFAGNLKIVGSPYDEIRIGTKEDGSFVIPNVPVPGEWYVYGKMSSIAALGATAPATCATVRDLEEVNVGDLVIHPGHRFQGSVKLSDGAPVADGMRMTLSADRIGDSQTVILGRDGRFEFVGLPAGGYDLFPSVKGYELQDNLQTLSKTIDRDEAGLTIALKPVAHR